MRYPASPEPAGPARKTLVRRVLYVAYWGLLEPLGQSLIAPAVVGLAARGFAIDLVTFEKANDLGDAEARRRMRARLSAAGVRWVALRYHKRPTALAKVVDIAAGVGVSVWLALRHRPDLVHGRTFIGGLVGCVAAKLTRRPWVYHGEGFWPDQQVEGGYWSRESAVYRVTHRLDRWLYGQASAAILLSRRSRPTVEALPRVAARRTPIVIVPSCVDLDRFPRCAGPALRGAPRLVYVGSLGGRYLIEPLGALLGAVRRRADGARLHIYSPSDPLLVAARLAVAGVPRDAWDIRRVSHAEIPSLLAQCDAGLFFLAQGPGSESCSPTKIGEYWASGLPVVSTGGAGDIDDIIREQRVGVLVRGCDETSLATAAAELLQLLEDPNLGARCHQAAVAGYALDRGLDAQTALYRTVARRHPVRDD